MMYSLLLSVLVLPCVLTLEFRYHNNLEIEQYLHQINASNSDITYLYSIGQSVKGNNYRCSKTIFSLPIAILVM